MDVNFPATQPSQILKTYSKMDRQILVPVERSVLEESDETFIDIVEAPDLTTKSAVEFLLEGTLKSKVCRYCLTVASPLSELDLVLEVAHKDSLYKVTIRDMIASFHPFKVDEDPNFPNKICEKCLDRTLTSYLFTQQCERADRALRNCVSDMYDKLDKLDPLERTKKRGRHKLNPNYNRLHTDHKIVMDYADPVIQLIHAGCEPISTQLPIKEFECLKCSQVLTSLESLTNHVNTHPKTMWFNCRLCGQSYPKLYQIKKHLRSHQQSDNQTKPPENKKFECKTCGSISEGMYEHLQHIEKHKFKTVMDHLLERKMDKLCAICLDKGSNLTDLDKMICLHGGCPELSGDKPLFNILTSTLPQRKNKYQELLVPRQARLIEVIKKKSPVSSTLLKMSEYYFSVPIVVSLETVKGFADCLYLFSKPRMLDLADNTEGTLRKTEMGWPQDSEQSRYKYSEIDLPQQCDKAGYKYTQMSLQIDCKQSKDNPTQITLEKSAINEQNQAIKENNEETVHFTFSKPKYDIIDDKNDDSLHKYGITLNYTKECQDWIFDKCMQTTDIFLTKDINKLQTPCSKCWVFKHLNMCEYCKNPNKNPEKNIATESSIEKPKQGLNKDICKENSTANVAVKACRTRNKWQCLICLTNNQANRQMCYCCENKSLNLEKNIFQFSSHKLSNLTKEMVEIDEIAPIIEQQIDEVTQEPNASIQSETNIDSIGFLDTATNGMETESNCNNEAMDVEEIPQAIEYQTLGLTPGINAAIQIRALNTETNVTRMLTSHVSSYTSMIQSHEFNFAIGTAESNIRRHKKLGRKFIRAIHK